MIDGCLCRAFWDHTRYANSKKVTWKSFILSHDFNQALVDAFVPLVLESQTRLAPMSLCPSEDAFGQVVQICSHHHLDFCIARGPL